MTNRTQAVSIVLHCENLDVVLTANHGDFANNSASLARGRESVLCSSMNKKPKIFIQTETSTGHVEFSAPSGKKLTAVSFLLIVPYICGCRDNCLWKPWFVHVMMFRGETQLF